MEHLVFGRVVASRSSPGRCDGALDPVHGLHGRKHRGVAAGRHCPQHSGAEQNRLGFPRQHQPAAVVLDLLMPEMDGFEFLRIFRRTRAGRRTPVIVWTVEDLTAEEVPALLAALRPALRTLLGAPTAERLLEEIQREFK